MMDTSFLLSALLRLLPGVPLTLQLTFLSVTIGAVLALVIALFRLSGIFVLAASARIYVFIFRSTPLLVQIFLIYYGLSQFHGLRYSFVWPVLREPYWCAIIALALNTAAYSSEIIRGGLQSVPEGQIEAARACGMSRIVLFRRIVLPIAIRQALPAYGNEIILMVKATALASIITMMEITGLAAKLISETYRAVEVFVVAGSIYLIINFAITRLVQLVEYGLTPHRRPPPALNAAPRGGLT
jgi:octopine/nopaline transport system permease protein